MSNRKVILEGKKINKIFGHGPSSVHAVNDVDFKFHEGEIISIVGESGSGKTTLAKMILGLIPSTSGELYFNAEIRDIKSFKNRKKYWESVQAIFQDPFSSFNEFYKVETLLSNCLDLRAEKMTKDIRIEKMREACLFVNLDFDEIRQKHPFELSGGQMQRVMIARIFLIHPKVLIADEPTSMIDACSRANILEMLMKLRDENKMTIVFITHDLGLAYYVSDTVYIMEHGEIVERGDAESVIATPTHQYTKQLISDVPKLHEPWDLG
jgi:peptide/nickel transport system ATP-binding protein